MTYEYDAWGSFLTVHNPYKDGKKKVTSRICKEQLFNLSHHSQREVLIVKLEENGYAYLQSAIDHILKEILHD